MQEVRQRLIEHPRCPYCRDPVEPSDAKLACDACMTWHHADCWAEHGRCSSCQADRVAGSPDARAEHERERVEAKVRDAARAVLEQAARAGDPVAEDALVALQRVEAQRAAAARARERALAAAEEAARTSQGEPRPEQEVSLTLLIGVLLVVVTAIGLPLLLVLLLRG